MSRSRHRAGRSDSRRCRRGRAAYVAAVDLPRLAQSRPLERFAFALVTLAEAQQAYLARERELAQIREAIDFQRRR